MHLSQTLLLDRVSPRLCHTSRCMPHSLETPYACLLRRSYRKVGTHWTIPSVGYQKFKHYIQASSSKLPDTYCKMSTFQAHPFCSLDQAQLLTSCTQLGLAEHLREAIGLQFCCSSVFNLASDCCWLITQPTSPQREVSCPHLHPRENIPRG